MAEEELFDIIIPPGTPRTIIADVAQRFDVRIVERTERINIANMEGDERNLLAFRGKREVLEEVEVYMLEKLREFIE